MPRVSPPLRDLGVGLILFTHHRRLTSTLLLSPYASRSAPLLWHRRSAFRYLQLLSTSATSDSAPRRDLFLHILERVRRRYRLIVLGYVVMPEHVHLLLSEPQQATLSTAIQALKLGFVRCLYGCGDNLIPRSRKGGETWGTPPTLKRFWQARFYDFNVWTERKRVEKLNYMHRNPVKRGLVALPEEWRWSSFRWYFQGEMGAVRVNDTEILLLKIRLG